MAPSLTFLCVLFAAVNANDVESGEVNEGPSIEANRGTSCLERLAEIETILRQQSIRLNQQQQEIKVLKETVKNQNYKIENLKIHRGSENVMQTVLSGDDSNVRRSTDVVSGLGLKKDSNGKTFHEGRTDSKKRASVENLFGLESKEEGVDERTELLKDSVKPRIVKRLLAENTQTAVGFYAYMGHSEITPGPHHTIIFDVVKTNSHGGYNRNSGIFTVSVAGIYGFIFTMRMPCLKYGTFEIMKNSEVQGTIHVNTINVCAGQMSTGAIITAANQGDIVYIRTHSTIGTTGNILSDQHGWPYFLGWLISA